MYIQPKVKSSYNKGYDLGRVIYDYTMKVKPNIVAEIGTYRGYSAICIAQALRDLGGERKLYCYDLWQKSPHAHCHVNEFKANIKIHGVEIFVSSSLKSFDEVIENLSGIDMLHIDISNNGDIIKKVYDLRVCNNVIFEGGSKERDNIPWMKKFLPINGCCPYTILDEHFPSISVIDYE